MGRNLRFILLFMLAWGTLTAVVFRWAAFREWLCRAHASVLARLLQLMGIACETEGIAIHFPGHGSFVMVLECTAVFVSIVFLAGIIAYPAPWKMKWSGIVRGLPLIAGINIVRLVMLGLLFARAPRFFKFFHAYLWHVAFVVIVVLMLIEWTERVRGTRKSAHIPA